MRIEDDSQCKSLQQNNNSNVFGRGKTRDYKQDSIIREKHQRHRTAQKRATTYSNERQNNLIIKSVNTFLWRILFFFIVFPLMDVVLFILLSNFGFTKIDLLWQRRQRWGKNWILNKEAYRRYALLLSLVGWHFTFIHQCTIATATGFALSDQTILLLLRLTFRCHTKRAYVSWGDDLFGGAAILSTLATEIHARLNRTACNWKFKH